MEPSAPDVPAPQLPLAGRARPPRGIDHDVGDPGAASPANRGAERLDLPTDPPPV